MTFWVSQSLPAICAEMNPVSIGIFEEDLPIKSPIVYVTGKKCQTKNLQVEARIAFTSWYYKFLTAILNKQQLHPGREL